MPSSETKQLPAALPNPLPTSAELELRQAEREVLEQEVGPFAETLRDPAARERYLALDRAVRGGVVPADLVKPLEAMLELVLQTRRIRQRHGPEGEQALNELFYRTERGAGLRQASREVNAALETFSGQTLEKITLLAGPGRHTLIINTDRARLTLKVDAAGARIENLEVGG
jgi:hypothetical protein